MYIAYCFFPRCLNICIFGFILDQSQKQDHFTPVYPTQLIEGTKLSKKSGRSGQKYNIYGCPISIIVSENNNSGRSSFTAHHGIQKKIIIIFENHVFKIFLISYRYFGQETCRTPHLQTSQSGKYNIWVHFIFFTQQQTW